MGEIEILWISFWRSQSYTGYQIGYKRDDGLVGSFDSSRVNDFRKHYTITNEDFLNEELKKNGL